MSPPKTVLIWRFSSAGDVVLTAPAVAALARAWPQSRIVYATKQVFVPLVASNPHIHEVIGCASHASFWQLRRALAACHADALCDLHGKARGLLLRLTLPAQRRAAWRKRDLDQTCTMAWGTGRYRARMTIVMRYHQAVERLVGRKLASEPLRYYVNAKDMEAGQRWLDTAPPSGPNSPRQLRVGLSPGALWATKRWPLERFAALAARLQAQGLQVILTGSPQEKTAVATVASAVPGALDLAGRLTLGELGGVIAGLDAFVANDSGPMHIARALGVPTLAFFGSTDPAQFDGTGHRLLFSQRDCAPCSFHGLAACPRGHLGCLMDLSVESAFAHTQALVHGGRQPFVLG